LKYKYAIILITFFLTGYTITLRGQQHIELDVNKQPLNKVLMDLSSRFGINVSFDNTLLSKYNITAHRSFSSPDEAISFLLKKIPVAYERSNNVFLIYPSSEKNAFYQDSLTFSGMIFDKATYEPLPYSLLCINNKYVYTDSKGWFSYNEKYSDSINVAISYLGYNVIDTLIASRPNMNGFEFFLQPKSISLHEVPVKKNLIINQSIIGRETGKVKLNSMVAHYLPGIGDNSLFQFLSMMPGIRQVSGNSSGISVWGSSPENLYIDFDGIRIYKASHFFGNIGIVNPLTIKDIEVYKGAVSSEYQGAESGLIRLTGKNGNRVSPSFSAEINNLTLNTFFETPAGTNNTLVISLRGMYRDPEKTIFFNKSNGNAYAPYNGSNNKTVSNNLSSAYVFGDAQLKFSGSVGAKRSYYLNLYQSYDKPTFVTDTTSSAFPFINEYKQRWGNSGMAFSLTENWTKNKSSSILASYSSNYETYRSYTQTSQGDSLGYVFLQSEATNNQLKDYAIKNVNTYSTSNNQLIKYGIGGDYFVVAQTILRNDTLQTSSMDSSIVPFVFVQDNFAIGSWGELSAGARANYSSLAKNIGISPNLSFTARMGQYFSGGINMGRTQLYISKIPYVFADYTNNSYYALCNSSNIPTFYTNQLSASFNFISLKYQFTAEAFYKKSFNISEYVPELIFTDAMNSQTRLPGNIQSGYYQGDSYSKGFCVYQKAQLGPFTAWGSYSYTDSKKNIPELYGDRWVDNSNSEKHEIKGAAVYQIWKVVLSASYIYGSGFGQHVLTQDKPKEEQKVPQQTTYQRLDFGTVFKFKFKKLDSEVGCSVLNVFNNKNYNYFNYKPGISGESNTNDVFFEINTLPRSVCFYFKMKL
jgi:hypothetical protein